jgi:hypothetical protein
MRFPILIMSILAGLSMPSSGWTEDKWFAGIYGGRASDNRLLDILSLQTAPANTFLMAGTIGKELKTYGDYLQWEVEGQIVKHFEQQTHLEFNGLVILRWMRIPWDNYLDTSLAIGDGLSYATRHPSLEQGNGEKTAHLLNYLMIEVAFNCFRKPSLQLFVRIHHRSGVYGLFNGVTEGSNFLCLGLRWTL